MKIDNPKVTLADDARKGVEEEVRSGFLDWLFTNVVRDDEGEIYEVCGSLYSMHDEQMDLVTMQVTKGTGRVKQLPNSIYKVGEYPGLVWRNHYRYPAGTAQIEMGENSVVVTCGENYRCECFEDNRWHIQIKDNDGEFSCDLWHKPYGYPLWYGREKPSSLTKHSVTYGYNWAGECEGEFTLHGKTLHIVGSGQRERYVALDSSAAELGGWEDWGYFTFDQIHSSLYDMRLGMKDFSVYDIENQKHYPEGTMTIEHEDWVFARSFDGFIPNYYNVRIEVEDGTYQVRAHVGNLRTWGVTFKVPDMPVATLVFDSVEGTFTHRDGSIRQLTGGSGSMSIRQWRAYPTILPRELYLDGEGHVATDPKYSTF